MPGMGVIYLWYIVAYEADFVKTDLGEFSEREILVSTMDRLQF